MRKLLIICFYELKDYLTSISTAFTKKHKWDVVAYPLYMYCYDKFSKIDNYADHLSNFFKKEKPDVVLWWFNDVELSIFTRIKKEYPDPFYIIYNYADPMNINKIYLNRCTIFNHVITVCQCNMLTYKMKSKNKYVDFFPFGFDPKIFYPHNTPKALASLNQKYKSDISFICDSLYTDSREQLIERKKIINDMYDYCKTNNLIFCVYGPDFISHFAKDAYKGDVKYTDIPSIALLSKINIITHPDSKKKLGLCNPNLIPILACGGIVLMDKINGSELFFNNNKKTVFMYTKDNLTSEIATIINLYKNNVKLLDDIRYNATKFVDQYSWDKFAEKIYLRYMQDKFNGDIYSKVYKIPPETTLEHMQKIWYISYLKGEYQIPFEIYVPSNFDMDNYRSYNGLKKEDITDTAVYIHWYANGKNADYLKRYKVHKGDISGNSDELSGSLYNVTTTKLFDLFRGFNMMCIYNDLDTGLDTLNMISKQNPMIKINDALEKYIDISYTE